MIESQRTETDVARDVSFRVVIESVGTAVPAASAALAKGFNLPVDQVVACCYRAPSVLAEGIDGERAEAIVALLVSIGFEARAESVEQSPPGPQFCLDVALYLRDPAQLQACAEVLAAFVGASVEDAMGLIMRPPGVVLGNVSRATIDAFQRRLPEGVELLWSRPEDARYVCLVLPGAPLLQRSVWDDLRRLGHAAHGREGIVVGDLDHSTVRQLWQRHHAGGVLQIVNQDFLRFDIRLSALPPADADAEAIAAALERHTEIPPELFAAVLAEAPITLIEALPQGELAACLEDLHGAGLPVSAECITFQACQLAIMTAPGAGRVRSLLQQLSLHAAQRPDAAGRYALEPALNDLQARSLHALLNSHGVETVFCETGA